LESKCNKINIITEIIANNTRHRTIQVFDDTIRYRYLGHDTIHDTIHFSNFLPPWKILQKSMSFNTMVKRQCIVEGPLLTCVSWNQTGRCDYHNPLIALWAPLIAVELCVQSPDGRHWHAVSMLGADKIPPHTAKGCLSTKEPAYLITGGGCWHAVAMLLGYKEPPPGLVEYRWTSLCDLTTVSSCEPYSDCSNCI
jgi:hypothetical protein